MKRLQLSHQQQVCDQAEPVTHFLHIRPFYFKITQTSRTGAGRSSPTFPTLYPVIGDLLTASLDHCWLSVVLGLSLGLAGPSGRLLLRLGIPFTAPLSLPRCCVSFEYALLQMQRLETQPVCLLYPQHLPSRPQTIILLATTSEQDWIRQISRA